MKVGNGMTVVLFCDNTTHNNFDLFLSNFLICIPAIRVVKASITKMFPI